MVFGIPALLDTHLLELFWESCPIGASSTGESGIFSDNFGLFFPTIFEDFGLGIFLTRWYFGFNTGIFFGFSDMESWNMFFKSACFKLDSTKTLLKGISYGAIFIGESFFTNLIGSGDLLFGGPITIFSLSISLRRLFIIFSLKFNF